jgi:DNA-binding IclR family transcriptional regulator
VSKAKVRLTLATTLRAVHDLRDGDEHWPTADEIAEHLKVPTADVHPMLVELKARRLLRDRRRGERREWGRW